MEAFRCDNCLKLFGGQGGFAREVPLEVRDREFVVTLEVWSEAPSDESVGVPAELCPGCLSALTNNAAKILRREHEVKTSST
jgi:hypothetical protein